MSGGRYIFCIGDEDGESVKYARITALRTIFNETPGVMIVDNELPGLFLIEATPAALDGIREKIKSDRVLGHLKFPGPAGA